MVRPKSNQPTPGELEVLQVLWDQGESTVRDVLDVLNRRKKRAYTSVMSLLNVMTEKGFLVRRAEGRAFVYRAKLPKEKTLGKIVRDVVGRAFDGSAATLVTHLLDQAKPTSAELDSIKEAIEAYEKQDEIELGSDASEVEGSSSPEGSTPKRRARKRPQPNEASKEGTRRSRPARGQGDSQ